MFLSKRRPTLLTRVELPKPSGLKPGLTRRLGVGWGWLEPRLRVELKRDAEGRKSCGRMGRS